MNDRGILSERRLTFNSDPTDWILHSFVDCTLDQVKQKEKKPDGAARLRPHNATWPARGRPWQFFRREVRKAYFIAS
jgi:hypothetical protein